MPFSVGLIKKTLLDSRQQPQKVVRTVGDVDAAFGMPPRPSKRATTLLCWRTPRWSRPLPLAHFREGKVEAWAATQNPQSVQKTVSKALGIKQTECYLSCHVTWRRLWSKIQTRLRCRSGAAFQQTWQTRQNLLDARRRSPLRLLHSTSGMYFKAGLDSSGKPSAWLQRTVFPPIGSTFDGKEPYGGLATFAGLHSICLSISSNFALKTGRPRLICALDGCARSPIFITLSVFNLLSKSSRTLPAKIPSNIGSPPWRTTPDRSANHRKPSTLITANRSRNTHSILAA